MRKKWNAIARYFLGIVFLVAGINGYVYLLAPLIANIFLLHVFVDHSLLALAIVMVIAYGLSVIPL